MLRYISRRLAYSTIVLIAVSIIVFALMHFAGDPLARLRLNPYVRPADIVRLEKQMGLDKPAYLQYFYWLRDSAKGGGQWADSFTYKLPVYSLILDKFKNTLVLIVSAVIFTLFLAIPIGVYSAYRQYSLFDHTMTFFSFLGYSMPIFWFGLILQLIFGFYLWDWTGIRFFYTASMYSAGQQGDIMNRLQHLVLPVVTLSLASIAGWSRYQRSSMLDVIHSDYIRTARAKGLSERAVILKHALRNALIPVVTIVALDFAALLGGAVVTETIFAWPGMGRLFYNAVIDRDYPLVMGAILFTSIIMIVFNLIADITYGFLDPRIRYE